MTGTASSAAPGRLETVRRFVNTRDIEAGTDAIEDTAGLRRWLRDAGLIADDDRVGPDDLARAHEVREALRDAAMANHDRRPLPPAVIATLEGAANLADLRLSLTPDARWVAEVRAKAVTGALGRLVVEVTDAMTAGTWPRLKICANDACRWAFYDHSRASTGKWCSMRLCGNRAKQKAWRDRREATGQAPRHRPASPA